MAESKVQILWYVEDTAVIEIGINLAKVTKISVPLFRSNSSQRWAKNVYCMSSSHACIIDPAQHIAKMVSKALAECE